MGAPVYEDAVAPAETPALPGSPGRGRQLVRSGSIVLSQVAAFVLSMGLLILILWAIDYNPGHILSALWDGSLGSNISIGTSLNEAIPLVLTAVGIWVAFQGGLYNIGADGQLQVGGFVTVITTFALPTSLHPIPMITLSLLAGVLAGAAWSSIAVFLKTYRGANEIISTIMLNYIAFIAIDQLIRGPFQSEENPYTPQTDVVPANAEIDAFIGRRITWGILVALVVGIAVLVLVRRTTWGLRLRALGLNRDAVRRSGVSVRTYWIGSFCLSGALCGLGGALFVLAEPRSLAEGWASPWGFTGMIIAFLALSSPYMIPVWALLFGMLASAGPALKGTASVPDSMVTIMQTLPVIVLFLLYALVRWLRRRTLLPREPLEAPPLKDTPSHA
jgi:simple sugar transport system permease protein